MTPTTPAHNDEIYQALTSRSDVQLKPTPQLRKNRSFISVLGMALAITAVPFGICGPLISAIYGGGQLALFVGVLVVIVFQSTRLLDEKPFQNALAYLTGWVWLIGNWTIALSVNFGFASLIVATASMWNTEWTATPNQTLFIFFGICVLILLLCIVSDRLLPFIDTAAAIWSVITVVAILIALSVTAKSGRHSASYGLGHYDGSISGWGQGFSFFIGLLPPAYSLSAIGMVMSMAEECSSPEIEVPRGITLCVPIGGVAMLLLVLPICFTLPALEDVLVAPYGQALPHILGIVTGSKPLTLALLIMVLLVTLFCSLSITTTASRCTWALSRDGMLPFSRIWSRTIFNQPVSALVLVTVLQMILGCINLGSTSAFTAFVSVGVIALATAYLIPISISLSLRRKEVSKARWMLGPRVGTLANCVAICWIVFQLVLFSMPTALPVTAASMNYAPVVFGGLLLLCALHYCAWGKNNVRRQELPPTIFVS
ncbi:amino acid permease-domain-containing protein [Dactylonectria estremocensis]|uniref:Amino acid permease-domain-containing protein n=1 Tax=Dactylonectria estremocensis TaxID=1079267 RepID=A0A9P9CYS0_9HYPO|nr:amino acid permease-domain-containing protein [Dactylonectria estremocensis]